mmetsp:Transcript_49848/g.73226  ORF Transcript_49848/g.73226 Transcript_49848/m.73226 type:complete len:272 (-) Transcript_49848:459-1274(-)
MLRSGGRRTLWAVTILVSTGWCSGFVGVPPQGGLLRRSQDTCSPGPAHVRSKGLLPLRAKKSIRDILNEDHEMIPNQPLKGLSGGPEQEFELNRGLALDTLLKDYPYLLEKAPDFSIFRKEVILQDAQGFRISGLQAYQFFFTILRRLAQTASGLGVQACVNVMVMDKYATDKGRIRLRWKIELYQKGKTAKPLSDVERDTMLNKLGFKPSSGDSFGSGGGILEGISVYKLDSKGMINSHTIEVTEPTVMAPLQALQKFFPLGTSAVPTGF